MNITFKGMKFEAVAQSNGAYRIETEGGPYRYGRYFIRVEPAISGKGWIAQIWKHTNCFGGCEIVRNITTKRDGLVRRATARTMMRAALEAYGKTN